MKGPPDVPDYPGAENALESLENAALWRNQRRLAGRISANGLLETLRSHKTQ